MALIDHRSRPRPAPSLPPAYEQDHREESARPDDARLGGGTNSASLQQLLQRMAGHGAGCAVALHPSHPFGAPTGELGRGGALALGGKVPVRNSYGEAFRLTLCFVLHRQVKLR